MKKLLMDIFSLIFAVFAFVFLFVYLQTHYMWGRVHIEQILINLNEGLDFASDKLIWGYVISMALGLATAFAVSVILKTNKRLFIVSSTVCLFVLWQIGVFSYLLNKKVYSAIYETEYIFPQNLTYHFPAQKRNLIVIYLESGEENYATDLETNIIPNISRLAQNNLSFEGFHQIVYQDYTIAAMIESMCAVPYRGSKLKGYEGYQNFLTSLVCYPEILQKNGYETVFIKGADIDFARTGLFMRAHGFDVAMGASELNEKYAYPLKENKGGFGGYNDATLYKMVKEELLRLSENSKPFFLSFLTLDTHAPDYFLSPVCKDNALGKKDIVLCGDKMLADFIGWLEAQPFYENTTVVVLGDHPETGINRLYPKLQNRRIINFVLNPSPDFQKVVHTGWTTLDVAPTVLNAAGISFDEKGFGLGRSLFSDKQTLYEKFGRKLETELLKSSHVYDSFETVKNKKLPQYHLYEPLGKRVSTPQEIEYFATYAKNLFGVVFLEELSFSLPRQDKDLVLNISFKSMLSDKKKRKFKVMINGVKSGVWEISLTDRQPISKSVVVKANQIKDGKLSIYFEGEDFGILSDGLGVGVLNFSLSEQ